MQTEQTQVVKNTLDFNPEKERIDLSSIKIQMLLGGVLIFAACLSAYWGSLKIGFLLDDYLHLSYCSQAAQGHWQAFFGNFTGNWAGSDLMKSYRPITSLTLLADYLVWGKNAFGFHLTNILLLFGCSTFVSLIALELSEMSSGSRLGAAPAIWAGLLFAAYPLHPEAVAWVIGRVDLLCTLFFLACLFCYLRFRLLKERGYLYGSLLFFLLSLLSKEMSVTLPAVITLAELCLPLSRQSAGGNKNSACNLLTRCRYTLPFWILLAIYAVFRQSLLGTLVGGYGSSGIKELFGSWKVFCDRQSLAKIILPVNEELPLPAVLPTLLGICYLAALGSAAMRLFSRSLRPAPLMFLSGWAIFALAPTFQIWHIYPNLVGSRLFFLSSAPLSIIIVFLLLPALDTATRKQAQGITVVATLLLLSLFLAWSAILQVNLRPWLKAGQIISGLTDQLRKMEAALPPGKQIYLADLPTDFQGAGLLTRGHYLNLLADLYLGHEASEKFVTEDPPARQTKFDWSSPLQTAVLDPNCAGILAWNRHLCRFTPWVQPTADSSFSFRANQKSLQSLKLEPQDAVTIKPANWSAIAPEAPIVEDHQNFLRLKPGGKVLTLRFAPVRLDSLKCSTLVVYIRDNADSALHHQAGNWQFVWKTADGITHDSGAGAFELVANAENCYILRLNCMKEWVLSRIIESIALRFGPSDSSADFFGLDIGGQMDDQRMISPKPSPAAPDL